MGAAGRVDERNGVGKRQQVRSALEALGKPLLFAGLWLTKLYRPTFHVYSPVLHQVSDRLGVYPVIDHYHEPLIAPKRHLPASPAKRRSLPGIDLDVDGQLALLARFAFQDELLEIPQAYSGLSTPYYDNVAFPPSDAQILFSVIRHYKPRRILEVGSGETTRFALHALQLNAADDLSHAGEMTCIEPFEAAWLAQTDVDLRRSKVEDVDLSVFRALEADDILFIDSSHVARPRGDVMFLYQEVLPNLAPGVVVHVHDMFTPRDYPRAWIERRMLWDEQYVVEALLTQNPCLSIMLTVNCLYHDHRDELRAACPAAGADDREPCSLWLRVVEPVR